MFVLAVGASGQPFEADLNLLVAFPSLFSRGGWFFIEFSSLVDEIDLDQSFGHRTEKAPNADPSKPEAVKKPSSWISATLAFENLSTGSSTRDL